MSVVVTPLSNPVATKMVYDAICNNTAENDVLSGSCHVHIVRIDNTANAAKTYLKIYDSAAPTVGTTAPDLILCADASVVAEYVLGPIGVGKALSNLSFAAVTAPGTAGTTSPTSNVPVTILAT